jgi:casein kinase 1
MPSSGHGANAHDRRKEADRHHRESERRRASQQPGAIAPPSPVHVRPSPKPRKVPAALTPGGGSPGQLTPHSTTAQVNVPIGTPGIAQKHRSSQMNPQHPYANASGGFDYGRDVAEDNYAQQYGRASPMVSTAGAAAPPALNHVRARAGDVGVSNGGDYHGQDGEQPGSSLWRILTCRCG